MYGYRHGEVPMPESKLDHTKVDPSMRFSKTYVSQHEVLPQVPISATLPIYFSGSANPRPDPNFPPNVVIGVLARNGTVPPKASPILLAALKTFTRSFVERNLAPLSSGDAEFEDWLSGCPYTAARIEELRAVWYANPTNDPFVEQSQTQIKGFIKDESYPEYKPPRCINSRADWFKCYSGPLFGAIGKRMFYTMEEFIKTVPVREQPDYMLEKIFTLVGILTNNDATSYECHFKKEIMEAIEFVLYDYMCENVPEYKDRMGKIKKVLSGTQNLIYKYFKLTMDCKRMSGEMCTSLGNGFTTVVLVYFWAWLTEQLAKMLAEGDDNTTFWYNPDLVPSEADWLQMGWMMKVEYPKSIGVASFCGNVFDHDDRLVVTNPIEALLDFGWTNKRYVNARPVVKVELLRAKGLSLAYQYNGCPILGCFGRKIIELTQGVKIRQSIYNCMNQYEKEQMLINTYEKMPPYIEPSPATRMLVEDLYNITIEEQLSFEKGLQALKLWTDIEMPFLTSQLSVTHYENYTAPVGEHWVYPGHVDHDAVRRKLSLFGEVTKDFVESYYQSQEN
jgi:hypothetical protein